MKIMAKKTLILRTILEMLMNFAIIAINDIIRLWCEAIKVRYKRTKFQPETSQV